MVYNDGVRGVMYVEWIDSYRVWSHYVNDVSYLDETMYNNGFKVFILNFLISNND